MPKTQIIDPIESRKAGNIKLNSIPVNQYSSNINNEIKEYGKERLIRVYKDMLIIREFETMLNLIKTQGEYEGISYNHLGPAHLSIGQEAAAVGQSVVLNQEDFIFGSHRSHGEILAKCLSSIWQMNDGDLSNIMESFFDGNILKIVQKSPHIDQKDLAENFVLYGILAEIFARHTGFNKGLGGSMHAFFPPFGSMPNNAIVGGSADIALGSALYKLINRKNGIVIANIGDASLGCGPVWESFSFACMDQYRDLWGDEFGYPPILFNIMNNHYGMGGQTAGETMGFDMAARVGAGINPDQMHAERVDGYNPLAVADATMRMKEKLISGKGPGFLDIVTYRISGHSPSDASSYRSKEEMDLWQQNDCILLYKDYLIKNNILSQSKAEEIKEMVVNKVSLTLRQVTDISISPYSDVNIIEDVMFSNKKIEALEEREPEVLMPYIENPRAIQLKRKERYAFQQDGSPFSANKLFTYRDGIFEAIAHRFYTDPTFVAYGEENRDWGGAFACYRGLTESLPYHRLFNSPISEGAIVGTACGYALSGGRVCVELMYCDFMGRAGDEIFNQISKWQSMSAGILKMPLVLRISVGNKYGAQHSQDWSAMVNHIPGLKVYYPATPYDAKGMLNLALSGTDPVIFFESQKTYGIGEEFVSEGVPQEYFEVEEGAPSIKQKGEDLTLITLGPTLYSGLVASNILKEKYNLSVELIDLRFVNPLNYDLIITSIKKTGRAVLVSDAVERGSILHNVASNITSLCFDDLDAPPVVIGSKNWITPAAEMEKDFFPQAEWIISAIHERVLPLPDFNPEQKFSREELVRLAKLGV
ncbi:MAG: thiamine pyrophosphate-dependent enzyme [Pontiellaceae bacterium]